MRRKDREIKKSEDVLDVLRRCDVIRLGLNSPDYPYVVPMNFGLEENKETPVLWLHCAREGLKLDLIGKDNRVGFECDCSHRLILADDACMFTMEYESVIGCGNIFVCESLAEKRRGLDFIMRHYAPERDFVFPEQALAAVCVLKLNVLRMTGKRLFKNPPDSDPVKS